MDFESRKFEYYGIITDPLQMWSTTYLVNHFVFETWILPSVVVYFGVNWAVKPGGEGGYLVYFLLGMCRWPLRAPTPL